MDKKPLAWSKLGAHFANEDKAREYMEFLRWGNAGPACPHCGGADPYKIVPKAGSARPGRKGLYKCRLKGCRKQFTVTVGTVFEDSHIPISKWLQALYLIGASKKGLSAHQLHRMMGVTYRSAWFMMHRLRYAMTVEPLVKLSGIVEADETYVGGKRRVGHTSKAAKKLTGRPGPHDKKKSAVVALVERGGRVSAFPVEHVNGVTLQKAIRERVNLNAHMMTDELHAYDGLSMGFSGHDTIKHSRGHYVDGHTHTNTVEGFFSLLKRGVNGTFHHVSKGHLSRYVTEFEFRYNARKLADKDRPGLIVAGAEGKRLTYKQPEGASAN